MDENPNKKSLSRRQFLKFAGASGALAVAGEGLFGGGGSRLLKTLASAASPAATQGDWHYGYCRMCMRGDCASRYRVENNVVMEVKGNVDSPVNKGALCPRGLSQIQNLYNPYRIKSPLKRTNPKKGIGEDPKWVEISWDEALNLAAEKLKAVHDKDPRGLLVNLGFGGMDFFTSFVPYIPAAFGTPNLITSNGPLCSVHYATELVQAAFPTADADYLHCDYHITIGRTTGGNIGAANGETRAVADAIARGMKLVVVDPRSSPEAAHGEWVPVIPGGDLPFVLGLINVIMHELKVMDVDFLTNRTNGPYLIGKDGGYYRSPAGKPQVLDADGKIVEFDAARSMQLDAEADTPDGKVSTAFRLVKAAMKEYTPEWAEEKSTVPAGTIRRIAAEFVQHARIGATIDINGVTFPLRPASIIGERGSINHQDGTVLDLACKVLNELVGAMDVPGGCLGCTRGPVLKPDADGTVTPANEALGVKFEYPPMNADLAQYFPYRHSMPFLAYPVAAEPEKYGLPYKIEAALIIGGNTVIGSVEPDVMAKSMAAIPFVVSIAYNADEVVALSDLVLPDHAMMERMVVNVYETTFGGFGADTLGLRMAMFRDPVKPTHNTMQAQDIVIEIFKRMELTGPMFGVMNAIGVMLGELTMAQLTPENQLDPGGSYTYAEILERALKSLTNGKGIDWFKENGLWIDRAPLEQCFNYYYFPEGQTRYQLYFEGLRTGGVQLRENLEDNNVRLPGVNYDEMFAFYDPITHWRETDLNKNAGDYDLLAFNFKIPNANFRLGGQDQLPWLMEVGDELDPYFNVVCLHPDTAASKGLRDGQKVVIESRYGKIEGRLKTSMLYHPASAGIAGALGRMVDSLGKRPAQRLHYNRLMGAPLNSIDPIAGGTENSVRVKVYAA